LNCIKRDVVARILFADILSLSYITFEVKDKFTWNVSQNKRLDYSNGNRFAVLDKGKTTDTLPFKSSCLFFTEEVYTFFNLIERHNTEFNHLLEIDMGNIQRTMAERFVARNHINLLYTTIWYCGRGSGSPAAINFNVG